jgi:NAD(P)-dependent dehydrogenase (short-subunit alcohol dehydrogenase family)
MANWTASDMPSQTGKLAIVTGANSGLGYYTALELARKGAQVILACRAKDKTEAAMHDIRKDVPGAKLEFMRWTWRTSSPFAHLHKTSPASTKNSTC